MNFVFSEIALPQNGTLAIPVFAENTLSPTAQEVNDMTDGALVRAIEDSRFKGKSGDMLVVMAPQGVEVSRVVLFGLGEPEELKLADFENLGGKLIGKLNASGAKKVRVILDGLVDSPITDGEAAARVAFGAQLASYRFDKYKTDQDDDSLPSVEDFEVASASADEAKSLYGDLDAIAQGVFLTRDLVSEPANSLYPETFAARCKELADLGVEVEVLGEAEMEELGMGALLGVGQGSVRESQLVVMKWNGNPDAKDSKPLAFVGKGVCFDTGGISLKPGPGMEEMKWDMGGAGTVTGLMKALAGRKAKVNAVGVIGLVENMPDGNAQRPGDIVKSMSGQTIEILNTDAEGRLVLADALWYTQDRFDPSLIIDLATYGGDYHLTWA